jgi:hypothetical protein
MIFRIVYVHQYIPGMIGLFPANLKEEPGVFCGFDDAGVFLIHRSEDNCNGAVENGPWQLHRLTVLCRQHGLCQPAGH